MANTQSLFCSHGSSCGEAFCLHYTRVCPCFWSLVQIVHSIDMTRLIYLPPLWSQLTSRLDTIELQKRFE